MKLPQLLLDSLASVKGFDKEDFIKIHESGEQVTSIRVNPFKEVEISNLKFQLPWTEYGYYLESRPSFTFDPLFHAGCYYVQEASSMFLWEVLKQTFDQNSNIKILDLCASPGGKTTLLASYTSSQHKRSRIFSLGLLIGLQVLLAIF